MEIAKEEDIIIRHLFRSVNPGLLFAMLYTWGALVSFIKLAVIIGRELGLNILDEEEIPFYPFRFNE